MRNLFFLTFIFFNNYSIGQEKILKIEIEKSVNSFIEKKELFSIEDHQLYRIKRGKKTHVLGNEELIEILNNRTVIHNLYINSFTDSIETCVLGYEIEYALHYIVFDKGIQISYTYLFSKPIDCNNKDLEDYLNLILKKIQTLN